MQKGLVTSNPHGSKNLLWCSCSPLRLGKSLKHVYSMHIALGNQKYEGQLRASPKHSFLSQAILAITKFTMPNNCLYLLQSHSQ